MSENIPPMSSTDRITLRAIEFFQELRTELITAHHIQNNCGDRIILQCFREHITRASENMTTPFSPRILEQVMVHVANFVRAVVDCPDHDRPICVELGMLLEQLLARRAMPTYPLSEK